MASSSGKGLLRNVPRYAPWDSLWDLNTYPRTGYSVSDDWYFAERGPQVATQIPWTWLSGPIRERPDGIVNAAAVTRQGGATAYATDEASIEEYKGQKGFTHTTYSANDQDPANLAQFMVTYYADPRVRLAQIHLILNTRTAAEIRTILRLEIGDRIHLTGTPTGWPEGAIQLVIEGITHRSAVDVRTVSWSLAPLIGEVAGVAGPWFRLGVSQLGGVDVLPW